MVKLQPWRTLQAANAGQGPKSREHFERVMKTGESQITLTDQARHAWPTPSTPEWKGGRKPETLKAKGRGVTNTLNDAINFNEGTVGQLNPDWVEHLMGFPPGWTNTDGPPLSGSHRGNGKLQD
ncbi:hypothetical protein GCM10007416_32330 [Kroppenstedtia guangzhouensis]|uniref:Uncharacterized protein n=1 Tax=Kroppenstedtia guangzhouensis TaxID=1274356 RepID=A0ABQ1H4L0_9BACL|nr:hypothetical protein GCM10007416_32330 [Kroppenstedtia guangzhouensis]